MWRTLLLRMSEYPIPDFREEDLREIEQDPLTREHFAKLRKMLDESVRRVRPDVLPHDIRCIVDKTKK